MKKIILAIFSGLAIFSLVACSGEAKASSAAEVSSTNSESQPSSMAEVSSDNTEQPMAGAYGEEHALTDEDEQIFSEATEGLLGVKYTPLAVSTQIVAGTNYRFRCSGETVNESGDMKDYYITVYVSLDSGDSPTITNISEI